MPCGDTPRPVVSLPITYLRARRHTQVDLPLTYI